MTIGYHSFRRRRLSCRRHNWRSWGRTLPAVSDIVDVDHLLQTFDDLKREAGQAPGIDRWRYADIGREDAANCLRDVSSAIVEGRYRPHPCREQEIPKRGGSRTLRIKTIMDRVVEAALDRALKNFWERRFLANSHGFRPRRSAWTLLASLSVAMATHHRLVLVNDDVRKAFDEVNLEILLDYHRQFIRDEALMNLIETIIRGNQPERRCGIHQGGAYSPTALNLYLHIAHDLVLDRDLFLYWWRYADNLVYLCQDMAEGRQVRQRCLSLMHAVGLTFKGADEQQWRICLAVPLPFC
jgi:RNA-directed DNA polymerase